MNIKYIIPSGQNIIDGAKLGIKPGDILALKSSVRYDTPLRFINIEGTKENPIVITNVGPITLSVDKKLSYIVKFDGCKHFRFLSDNDDIKLYGANIGIALDQFTTNFEVAGIEVSQVGFAGIMAKTDPTCIPGTNRGNFVLQDSSIHHCYVHDTGGEGFYVGNSFYMKGVNLAGCGTKFPHDIENFKIHNNKTNNTAWEGIQLGCGTVGCEVTYNVVENYGIKGVGGQNNGIQIGEGTGGICSNNRVSHGRGNGIIVLGLGDNVIQNNTIINAGENGIFCDNRVLKGKSFSFIGNKIISPKNDGMRIYAKGVLNVIKHNIIIDPGSRNKVTRAKNDAFVFKINNDVITEEYNNLFSNDMNLANYLINS